MPRYSRIMTQQRVIMASNNRLYYILPVSIAQGLDYGELQESDFSEVRLSNDGTLAIIEYTGEALPDASYLTHPEAIQLMHRPNWAANDNTV